MKELNEYIVEKLRINKDTSVYDAKYYDEVAREGIKFLRKYLPDLDEWKYYINVIHENKHTLFENYVEFSFVYSLPDIYNKRKIMEKEITNIEIDGEQPFSGVIGIWKDEQKIVFFLNDKH